MLPKVNHKLFQKGQKYRMATGAVVEILAVTDVQPRRGTAVDVVVYRMPAGAVFVRTPEQAGHWELVSDD